MRITKSRCLNIPYIWSTRVIERCEITLPLGLLLLAGYKKIPPYLIVRWTSATIEPTYLAL